MVYNNPKRPVPPPHFRPLIRQTVRGRVKDEDTKLDGRDLYVIEIREYRGDVDDTKGVPHVAILDRKRLLEAKAIQKAVWIPVTLCEEILEYLLKCRNSEGQFNTTDLESCIFSCKSSGQKVESVLIDGTSRRFRSFKKVSIKDIYTDGDDQEVIELRNELIPKLTNFLGDAIVRYRDVKGQMNVPSLYSASGERRFFFDLRDTRYGKRLYISQVTEYHRNVIAVPLDTLLAFRERLTKAVEFLKLEDGPGGSPRSQRAGHVYGGSGSSRKKRRSQPRRERQQKPKRQSGEDKKTDIEKEEEEKENKTPIVAGEKTGPTGDESSTSEDDDDCEAAEVVLKLAVKKEEVDSGEASLKKTETPKALVL